MPVEYLVSYGAEGFLARCAAAAPVACRRGDRILIRSHRGVEPAEVLGEASAQHARFLPERMLTHLVQPVADDDATEFLGRKAAIFEEAASAAALLELPIEVLDVELLLEPRTVIVHYLRFGSGKLRELVKHLAAFTDSLIEMQDINLGVATEYGDHEHERYCNSERKVGGGCGSGGCGSGGCGSGGCGSGGCGGGSCGTRQHDPVAETADDLIAELHVRPFKHIHV